jgi:ribonuclease P protein component
VFPKSLRIKKSSDFKLLFTKGRSLHSPQLKLQVLYGEKTVIAGNPAVVARPDHTPTAQSVGANLPTKYAVITPKGVGKAHDRNRIRRQLLAQLRAWHEDRYGKIGKAKRDMAVGNTVVGSTAATASTTDTTSASSSAQPIAMIAVYVKAPKDTPSKLPNLVSELETLLLKLS